MTKTEKFKLARALHDSQMIGYPPQAQAWIRQQFNSVVNAISDALFNQTEARYLRAIVDRDNFLEKDNPFKDDGTKV